MILCAFVVNIRILFSKMNVLQVMYCTNLNVRCVGKLHKRISNAKVKKYAGVLLQIDFWNKITLESLGKFSHRSFADDNVDCFFDSEKNVVLNIRNPVFCTNLLHARHGSAIR